MQKLINRICSKIERRSTNKINWIRTLYFNFRILPYNQAKRLPFLIYGKPAFNSLSGRVEFRCPITKGLVRINEQKTFAPSLQTVNSQINLCGTLIVRGRAMIGCGNKLIIAHGAVLDMGACTKIADFCNIDCRTNIVIGEGSAIAHRSQIMDSNHHFVVSIDKKQISNNMKPIYIGKQTWICNSTTITGGAKIPSFCIVGSNSLVNKDFSKEGGTCLIAGVPAKVIAKGIFRIYDQEKEDMLNEYFKNNDHSFVISSKDIAFLMGGAKHINLR